MYETPMLEMYGWLSDLSMSGNTAKKAGVNDLASVLNSQNSQSDNDGCNPRSRPWSHAGNCLS